MDEKSFHRQWTCPTPVAGEAKAVTMIVSRRLSEISGQSIFNYSKLLDFPEAGLMLQQYLALDSVESDDGTELASMQVLPP